MKFEKGLNRSTRPQDQPEGSIPFAKNGVRDLRGVNQNEPGFALMSAMIPFTPIGIIETSKFPVIISTDNTNTAIGYFDADNDLYIPIFNDTNTPYKLGLNTDHPVNGQGSKNYKAETVIAFTDFFTFPKFLNCDKPVTASLDDWRLFPQATIPQITVSAIDGGILTPGAYYILAKYHKNDGTETTFIVNADVVVLPGTTGTSTGKALEINFDQLDPHYDLVQVGIISKINGVISAFTLEPVTIGTGGKASVIYTGANITTTATLEELLVQPVSYSKVASFGQLNDALYGINWEREPQINMQKYALLARLEWVSELITVSPKDEQHASAKKRSFMHREVYCFYIRFSKTGGAGWTDLFPLPGPEPISSDLLQSSEATTGGLTAKVFQVEDTIRVFDVAAKTGTCGVWVNEDETYPDTPDYDASDIGGPNLRGQKVRFHRMPSLRWCKQNLYNTDSAYGKNKLDLLGVRVSNLVIPQQYADKLDGGYEIFYAKRTLANTTVIAQSALLHAARHGTGSGTRVITGPDTDYKTTSGNWHSQVDWAGGSNERPLVIDRKLFRFHAFDLLLNRPAITPRYMCQELKFRRSNLPMIEDYTLTGGRQDAPIVYLADYVKDGSPPLIAQTGKLIRKIVDTPSDKSQYVPNNLATGKWYNIQAETTYAGKLEGPELLDLSEIAYSNLWTGASAERPNEAAQFEVCFLSNMMNLPENLYLPFNGQSVVRAGPRQIAPVTVFGGDVFLCDYTFHTYGWHDQGNATYGDGSRDPFMGLKTVRRIACESASNIYNRFEIPGNIYSKWYPNSPLVKDDITNYITAFDRRIDPNQFGYDKASAALNDIIIAGIFNPQREDLFVFPFRIHRSGKLNKQLKTRSWRTFQPLDYYEMQKNMGVGVHIEGMDDRLLIHMENALFYTQDKLQLEQDSLSVVIGAGDIFKYEPQEPYSAKLGYAGTQHNLACVRTPAGYVFADSKQKQLFLFKGELKLLNGGLDPFFMKYLSRIDNNPFIKNGITIGYDPRFGRILFTFKNKVNPAGIKELIKTQEFIDSLTPGTSLVSDKGRIMRFLGENTSPDYQCSDLVPVEVNDMIITVAETVPFNELIGLVTPVSGQNLSYYILSGNTDGAVMLEAATGRITVANKAALDYEVRQQLVLQAKAVSANGLLDLFTITINITQVNEPPRSADQEYFINENAANGLQFGIINASDPENQPLNFVITAGNDDGVFILNSVTGAISIADNTTLDALATPVYLLTVSISDGVNAISIQVKINVADIDEAPPLNDDTINIYDTTADGTVVYQFSTNDPEQQEVVFELINQSHPGVFELDITTGEIRLVDNDFLNPATTPQYTVEVKASDPNQNSDTATLTINVLYDPEQLSFSPAAGSCSGGCPVGYTPTSDGKFCQKFTRIAATPPTGGTPFSVAPATDYSYSNFGAIIYQPGYNSHGTGTIANWIQTDKVWRNTAANLIDGPLNRCGVWASGAVPNNEPIGFSVPVALSVASTVYVAIAGDNRCKIAINGTTLVDQDPTEIGNSLGAQIPQLAGQGIALAFKFWHIYPFQLSAGTHYIGMEGVNFGGAAGFGAEIYLNTAAELVAAQLEPAYLANPNAYANNLNPYSNLNLLFSTRRTRGGTFSSGISGGYSCPVNYAMDGSVSPPECVLVETVASTTRVWASVQITSLRTNQVVAMLQNLPGQTFQGYPVPVYPPVNNHIDCGGSVTTYYNTPRAASVAKNDCTGGLQGSLVRYAVPGGIYMTQSSQQDADQLAQSDVDANKQNYANANGFCIQE